MPRTGSHGSPCCSIDKTFIYQFYLQTVIKKPSTPKKTYRNPIYLTREYKEHTTHWVNSKHEY